MEEIKRDLKDLLITQTVVVEKLSRIELADQDHEARIRTVEQRQWWFAGIASALGAGGTLLLRKLGLG